MDLPGLGIELGSLLHCRQILYQLSYQGSPCGLYLGVTENHIPTDRDSGRVEMCVDPFVTPTRAFSGCLGQKVTLEQWPNLSGPQFP